MRTITQQTSGDQVEIHTLGLQYNFNVKSLIAERRLDQTDALHVLKIDLKAHLKRLHSAFLPQWQHPSSGNSCFLTNSCW